MQWWGESILQFLACLYQHCEDRMLRSKEDLLTKLVGCSEASRWYKENDDYLGEDRSPQYWVCA